MKNNYMEKVTIITVCFNEEKTIAKTIESVLNQTYSNFEYIIKDGNSQDRTNEIIEKYSQRFMKKGIRFVHLTGKDDGIYNAMNLALREAKGKWVNYMNSGDSFYNKYVLEDIFCYKSWDKYGLLYGHVLYELEKGYSFVNIHNHKRLKRGIGICHQACFTKKDILLNMQFAERYKILADYDLLLRMTDNNIKFARLNLIVAKYNRRGVSTLQFFNLVSEKNNILSRYGKSGSISFLNKLELKLETKVIQNFPLLCDFLFCKGLSKDMNK